MSVIVLVTDNKTGDTETRKVADHDYFILCTGECYVANTQTFPKSDTHVVTIRGRHSSAPVHG